MAKEPDLFIFNSQSDKPAATYLNDLFLKAAQNRIPDIHFQWVQGQVHIQLREDGKLRHFDTVEPVMGKMIDTKIRSRATMDLSQHQIPIDGRIGLRYPGIELEVRVSLVPSHNGQKIVCRLLDQENASMDLERIRMPMLVEHAFREMINEPQGLILVTGPTGSGKTTTLYAALNAINDGTLNICTIEHPVEYVVKGFVQINVTPQLSFALGLRALLRQDPDVILIGEIRDQETAQIAIQAANTGHLVFATLHSNSAAQAVPRIIDLGVDAQTLASVLIGVIAQRLVPTLRADIEHEWTPINDVERMWLKKNGLPAVTGDVPLATSKDAFSGKCPIIELIRSDKQVRAAIVSGGSEMTVLNAAARQNQFDTLGQSAVRMVTDGVTTMARIRTLIKDDSVKPTVRRIGDVLIAQGKITFTQANQAAELQLRCTIEGKVKKFGQALIDLKLVSQDDVVYALGFTEGAVEFLNDLAAAREINFRALKETVELWRTERNQESIFDMLIEQNLISKERLYEEVYSADGYGSRTGHTSSLNSAGVAAIAAV
ncbi:MULTISPECIES: GspE/PulE family protein [Pseudomonas]|uniref:General secretion pathway protein E n=3 Tax=Pseudomonas putida group TaxID=136845 RepID=A0A1L7NPL7_PSEPU|nr:MULTISPECIES: GspE/PulE family protein [Pseudomonas]MBP2086325.1 general secretion pathway protein E [Pseudomonas sp. PvP089]MBP2092687.1 general secretion pathway protein E [Pseudomonas sp. PvP088]HCF2573683.1 type II/IV secretion system protein [Pseudomonas aeruginosa]AGN79099.1 general secretion pathway protein E [Pseudomonas putida H8234]MBA1319723.1 type II/IV secretion system protein [Pseudomonas monteilii]